MEVNIAIEDDAHRGEVFGPADRHLRMIRTAFDVRIAARDGLVRIAGEDAAVQQAARVVEHLQDCVLKRVPLSDELLADIIRQMKLPNGADQDTDLGVYLANTNIAPRGEGQSTYIQSMLEHDITLCAGPAGTGKTYLAVAVAVSLLKQQLIKRIALVRPAVEAGEKLGYLPGDMQAKVNPYLRPLFDAMHDMLSFDQIQRFMQNDVIEVIPLAFMRGRTLNQAVIILDEAQNATTRQMLMFLTRLGHGSKMVVTGDDSQSDLGEGTRSGFTDALKRLSSVDGISVVRLGAQDIVRHPLVQRVVDAYNQEGADG